MTEFEGTFTGKINGQIDGLPTGPGPDPDPGAGDEVITMYSDDTESDGNACDVFIGNQEVTAQVSEYGMYYRRPHLVGWFKADNLIGSEGVISMRPNKLGGEFKQPGVGRLTLGRVRFINLTDQTDFILGEARWNSSGAIEFYFLDPTDGGSRRMRAVNTGADFPRQFQYGIDLRLSILVP